MTTNYQTELQSRSSSSYIDSSSKRARTLLDKYGPWIDKYRGGVPRGWAAAIMMWESDGVPTVTGDVAHGEYGLYQVASYIPPTFGMNADVRYDNETNVFIGLMEQQYDAARWKVAFPDQVMLGTDDSYKLARLSFSIGWGGATGLAKQTVAASDVYPGQLYDAISSYVQRTGGVAMGGMSADLVWFRVLSIAAQWEIGRRAALSTSGPPTRVPAPPTGRYTIPVAYAMLFVDPIPIAFLGALALGAYALWRLV